MINIAEILKNVPTGTKLYSPIFGDVKLLSIQDELQYPIRVRLCDKDVLENFTEEGKYNREYPDGECILFPSKENRDWNKFKVEKSYKFKPFDRVLVRDRETDPWVCDHFSYIRKKNYICSGDVAWRYCILYNDETKHLVGTNKTI